MQQQQQQQMQMQPQKDSGGKNPLRLRLDLNLEIEVTLKASIHGDLTLSLLYVLPYLIYTFISAKLTFGKVDNIAA